MTVDDKYAVVMDIPHDVSFHPYVTSLWTTEEQATEHAEEQLAQFAREQDIDDEPEVIIDDLSARITRVQADRVSVVAYVEKTDLDGDAL